MLRRKSYYLDQNLVVIPRPLGGHIVDNHRLEKLLTVRLDNPLAVQLAQLSDNFVLPPLENVLDHPVKTRLPIANTLLKNLRRYGITRHGAGGITRPNK